MCFSAGVSFGAATILGATGIATVRQVQKPSGLLFAAIPLLFAVQQLAEGLVWLSTMHSFFRDWEKPCAMIFLLFAQVFWPVWVPLSILLMEEDRERRRIMIVLLFLGATAGVANLYSIVAYPVSIDVSRLHIGYKIDNPSTPIHFLSIFYFLAIVVTPFVSRVKGMRTVGVAILVSFIFTAIFYKAFLISVWCFFAALISVTIVRVFYPRQATQMNKHFENR